MSYLYLSVLDRAHTGSLCTVKDWNLKVIPRKIAEKLRAHGIEKVYDSANPVNIDGSLADEFWRAGLELAADVGMLCQDTERVIRVDEEELTEAIRTAPKEAVLGEGLDRVVMRSRQPEDGYPPVWCAPFGITVSEELFIPLTQGIAQHREVDLIEGPSLETVFGRRVLAGTPFETLAARLQAQMHREAVWRAGRPGMGFQAVITSPTAYGQLGGYGIPAGYRPTDLALILFPPELKTSYHALHKVVHTLNCGGIIHAGTWSMIGGYAGGAEGAAVASIACALLNLVVHRSLTGYVGCMDIRYSGNCGREGMWTTSVGCQALSRNTRILTMSGPNQVAGPCTEMLLYESAVSMMDISASGASYAVGPRSAGGRLTNYVSPLECKFCGEVLKGSAGMKLDGVNEISKTLIPRYEAKLAAPPEGKSFTECFDLRTLKPSKEWLEIYGKVKKELIDLGVPLEML